MVFAEFMLKFNVIHIWIFYYLNHLICISYSYFRTSISFLDLLYRMGCNWELERLKKARAPNSETPNCELHFSVFKYINPCGLDLSGILIFNHNAVVLKPNYIFD